MAHLKSNRTPSPTIKYRINNLFPPQVLHDVCDEHFIDTVVLLPDTSSNNPDDCQHDIRINKLTMKDPAHTTCLPTFARSQLEHLSSLFSNQQEFSHFLTQVSTLSCIVIFVIPFSYSLYLFFIGC